MDFITVLIRKHLHDNKCKTLRCNPIDPTYVPNDEDIYKCETCSLLYVDHNVIMIEDVGHMCFCCLANLASLILNNTQYINVNNIYR